MRFVIGAAALALALCVASAQAQITRVPTTLIRPITPIVLAHLTGDSNAQVTASHGSVTTAPNMPISAMAAMASFRLNFENGDHKLGRMAATTEGEMARFALTDVDEADPFAASGTWVNFTGGVAGAVSMSGGGTLQIPIEAGPANATFAIRGFEFRRRNIDANIRAVSVKLAPSGHAIEVSLIDDQRADFRPREGTICLHCDRARPYGVWVQYVWIPHALVIQTGSITGNEFAREAAQIPVGENVIRGFSFNFLNSDHYLAHIEVATVNGGNARFQDVNAGDPMRWQVDYATLRDH